MGGMSSDNANVLQAFTAEVLATSDSAFRIVKDNSEAFKRMSGLEFNNGQNLFNFVLAVYGSDKSTAKERLDKMNILESLMSLGYATNKKFNTTTFSLEELERDKVPIVEIAKMIPPYTYQYHNLLDDRYLAFIEKVLENNATYEKSSVNLEFAQQGKEVKVSKLEIKRDINYNDQQDGNGQNAAHIISKLTDSDNLVKSCQNHNNTVFEYTDKLEKLFNMLHDAGVNFYTADKTSTTADDVITSFVDKTANLYDTKEGSFLKRNQVNALYKAINHNDIDKDAKTAVDDLSRSYKGQNNLSIMLGELKKKFPVYQTNIKLSKKIKNFSDFQKEYFNTYFKPLAEIRYTAELLEHNIKVDHNFDGVAGQSEKALDKAFENITKMFSPKDFARINTIYKNSAQGKFPGKNMDLLSLKNSFTDLRATQHIVNVGPDYSHKLIERIKKHETEFKDLINDFCAIYKFEERVNKLQEPTRILLGDNNHSARAGNFYTEIKKDALKNANIMLEKMDDFRNFLFTEPSIPSFEARDLAQELSKQEMALNNIISQKIFTSLTQNRNK